MWKNVCISPETPIREVVKVIDTYALQIALVVKEDYVLLGTVTDGDIRRGLLKGVDLESPVSLIYKETPFTAVLSDDVPTIRSIMKRRHIRQVPVLDDKGRVVHLEMLGEFDSEKEEKRDNIVILMAGGLGTRLRPLTNACPKPLLRVGGKPVLETILDNFIRAGFFRFYISINYKAELIEEYFGDGRRWGVEILYIRETERMGTAGCLSLLPEKPVKPLIVMNGDLLTKVDFGQLLKFHTTHRADATMCVREYDYQIPYGVIHREGNRLKGLEEKPVHHYFVNAGIYVVEPAIAALIPKNRFYDMTDLFQRVIDDGKEGIIFPIREYWMDIGQIRDLEEADSVYGSIFI